MAAVALKAGLLMGVLRTIGEPKRMFQTKTLIHASALGQQVVINRGCFLQTSLGQSLIGKGHHKSTFVVFG